MSNSGEPSILIAGGAGYIGSHTAKLLSRSGMKPVILDNLATGNRFALRFGDFYQGSISDRVLLERILKEHQIAGAILFAAHAYVGESTQNPRKYYRNNIVAPLDFLDSLIDHGINHLVFSSSCSIYGVQEKIPITEESSKDPLSPYAESKFFLEKVLSWYSVNRLLSSACLRYFNASGAGTARLFQG